MDSWVSILLSGITAALIGLLYNIMRDRKQREYIVKKEKLDYKLQILRIIIGYRGQLNTIPDSGKELQVAVNQIFIAYQDNDRVLQCFNTFRTCVKSPLTENKEQQKERNDKVISALVSLLKEMCKDVGVDYNFSNDDLFTNPIMLGINRPMMIVDMCSPNTPNNMH